MIDTAIIVLSALIAVLGVAGIVWLRVMRRERAEEVRRSRLAAATLTPDNQMALVVRHHGNDHVICTVYLDELPYGGGLHHKYNGSITVRDKRVLLDGMFMAMVSEPVEEKSDG